MKLNTKILLFIVSFILPICLNARDNGDGTYSNPMIHADYPDCEIIRVGDDYYYLSSSFHFVPSNPIMHSKDLVNWKCISHTIPNYKMGGEGYDLTKSASKYGAGSWAPTLRYHKGMFYSACFVWDRERFPKTEGFFLVSRAKDIKGPWQTNVITDEKLYDPGLFFDDDGKVYVFHGQNKLFVTELDANLTKVISSPKQIVDGDGMFEGTHAYKINGMYYLYCTRWGTIVALRSKNILGPYEFKQILISDLNFPNSTLHQGGLVQTQTGQWWTVVFQDRGKHGRLPFLLPVTWKDGWPIVKEVYTHEKPDTGKNIKAKFSDWRSDDFSKPQMSPQWQWNHHPDDKSWSLTENKGYLRLYTSTRPVSYLRQAKNTIAQQVLGPDSGAIVKMDVSNIKNGDFAGIGLLSSDPISIAVSKENDKNKIVLVKEAAKGWVPDVKEILASVETTKNTIWLKAEISYLEYAISFYFSFDGKNFKQLGTKQGISYNFFADWLAPRYCIYNYATQDLGGFVDVDYFKYILPERKNNFYKFGDTIDTQWCDKTSATLHAFEWVKEFNGLPNYLAKYPEAGTIGGGKFHEPTSWAVALSGREAGTWCSFYRIEFSKENPTVELFAKGRGKISIHKGDKNAPVIAEVKIDSEDFKKVEVPTKNISKGVHKLTIVLEDKGLVLKSLTLK